ncbi:hypothetical protein C5B86_15530 [Haloferax sp. Atlit-19N]|nr:hypothetical protein C5B86_15530 [Haloferax sp. Atlit-19N]
MARARTIDPHSRRSNCSNGFETAATARRELTAQARALVSRREHVFGSDRPASEAESGARRWRTGRSVLSNASPYSSDAAVSAVAIETVSRANRTPSLE